MEFYFYESETYTIRPSSVNPKIQLLNNLCSFYELKHLMLRYFENDIKYRVSKTIGCLRTHCAVSANPAKIVEINYLYWHTAIVNVMVTVVNRQSVAFSLQRRLLCLVRAGTVLCDVRRFTWVRWWGREIEKEMERKEKKNAMSNSYCNQINVLER